VELRDGESFAIAGLFQQDYQNTVGQVPGLGNLPVLGALFRSASWRRAETELVIIVTPRLTNAAQSMAAAPDPLGGGVEQTLPKLILGGDPLDKPLAAPVGRQGK
jgi:pilus assembly protein CpaC